MRRTLATACAVIAITAVSAGADMTRETTTTYSGTVSSLAPSSSTIILKTEKAQEPTKYVYTEKTQFVDPAGATVSRESVTNQPVTIYTEKQGDQMVVTKVVTQKSTTAPAPMMEKKTTTTTTTEPVE